MRPFPILRRRKCANGEYRAKQLLHLAFIFELGMQFTQRHVFVVLVDMQVL